MTWFVPSHYATHIHITQVVNIQYTLQLFIINNMLNLLNEQILSLKKNYQLQYKLFSSAVFLGFTIKIAIPSTQVQTKRFWKGVIQGNIICLSLLNFAQNRNILTKRGSSNLYYLLDSPLIHKKN